MLSQLSYFPTWTPQRDVAGMYAIHLPRSSLFCEQLSVSTERGAERCDGKGPGHYEAGSARGMACVYAIPLKWKWARYVHAVGRSIF